MRKILVVDDDPDIADVIEQYFSGLKYDVCTMLEGERVPETASRIKPDLILLDLKLPDVSGMDVLKNLRTVGFQGPVVIITGNVSAGSAIEAMKEGACEYLPKPFSLDELGSLVGRLLTKHAESGDVAAFENESYRSQEGDEFVGRSPEILTIGKTVGQAASTDAPVLITGECGSGKELIARIIHQNSARKNKPFLAVDCGYPSPHMLEDELFGPPGKKDESDGCRGKLEECNGGTLLLDGVETMSLSTQSRLLRTLKKDKISSGEDRALEVDVRIIAASTRDLSASVREGKFMQELFYYLRVISISVPPLRDRKPDIPLLAKYFLYRYSGQSKKDTACVSADAMKMLMSHSWPGNVDELESNLHSAAVMYTGDQVLPEHLPLFYEGHGPASLGLHPGTDDLAFLLRQTLERIRAKLLKDSRGEVYDRVISSVEKALISMALEHCHGNQVKSADLLGINRNTLKDRMLKFGLVEKEKPSEPASSRT